MLPQQRNPPIARVTIEISPAVYRQVLRLAVAQRSPIGDVVHQLAVAGIAGAAKQLKLTEKQERKAARLAAKNDR